MEVLRAYISKQLALNHNKNLFSHDLNRIIRFHLISSEVLDALNKLDKASESILIDYLTDKAVQEFCQANQYYTINGKALHDLRAIYTSLLKAIKNVQPLSENFPLETILKDHFTNLKTWLKNTNSFAEAIYNTEKEFVEPVTCAEYSASLQIKLFKIELTKIEEPVLDIGCGKEGHLVTYLQERGIHAFGMDRFKPSKSFVVQSDWLEYDYGVNKWGTIISNLGFSNHFEHHHHRTDGNFMGYAKTYMNILQSLKSDGSFYYAPSLPFIEPYLEEDKYQIQILKIGDMDYKAAKVTKLK